MLPTLMPRSYVPKIIKIGLLVSEYPKHSLYINNIYIRGLSPYYGGLTIIEKKLKFLESFLFSVYYP